MQHHHMDKDDGNSVHHEVRATFLAAHKQIQIQTSPPDCNQMHRCGARNTDISTKEQWKLKQTIMKLSICTKKIYN